MYCQILTVFFIGLVTIYAAPVTVKNEGSNDGESKFQTLIEDNTPYFGPTRSVNQAIDEINDNVDKNSDGGTRHHSRHARQATEPLEGLETAHIESIAPDAEQMRSALATANEAINNVAEEAKGFAGRAMDYARQFTAPLNGAERANIPSSLVARARNFFGNVQTDTKSLVARSLGITNDVRLAGRSALLDRGDIVRALENKYLTRDGQDLVRSFTGILGNQ